MSGWTLPESARVGERDYPIHADFRDVLDVIERLNDREMDEQTRAYVALALFYEGFEEMPQGDYQEAVQWLFRFVNGGEEECEAKPQPKIIDWEQDKNMIVSDVNRVAGCEVRSLPFCHWWTFLSWFNSIGEGQLSTVVSIRDKRRRGKKLSDWEKEFYQKHRDKVDFRKKYDAEEMEEQERLKELLGE